MKICCTSDSHGYLPDIPDCDIFLHAGDITPFTNHKLNFQKHWLINDFNPWLRSIQSKYKIIIPGNHDFIFQENPNIKHHLDCILLYNELVEVEGIKIWGSPWTKRFFDWAFNMSAKKLYKLHTSIPKCDIILTHGPPYGFGDLCWRPSQFKNNSNIPKYQTHEGSPGLIRKILEIEPKYVFYGHIHEGFGNRKLENTNICNVSYVDSGYTSTNGTPQIFYL